MSDISKCSNAECPLKDKCWRWLAPSNSYAQAFGNFEPDENGNCKYFWDATSRITHVFDEPDKENKV